MQKPARSKGTYWGQECTCLWAGFCITAENRKANTAKDKSSGDDETHIGSFGKENDPDNSRDDRDRELQNRRACCRVVFYSGVPDCITDSRGHRTRKYGEQDAAV